MKLHALFLLGLCSWLVCGCTDSSQPAASGETSSAEVAATTNAAEPAADPEPSENAGDSEPRETAADPQTVELQLLEWSGIEELIASHEGQVVVVDLWATYCDPCRREFPGLIELSQAHPEEVVCISVSLDEVDDHEKALKFLRDHNATIDNVRCTTDPDTLYDEILKIGAIPAVYVYGRDGTMLRLFNGPTEDGGEQTYAGHITPFVQQLLDQS